MDRRGFILWLASLPAFLGLVREVPPVPAAPVMEALPEAVPLAVTAAEGVFPFFWDTQMVEGILSVPLLDVLIAADILVTPPLRLP